MLSTSCDRTSTSWVARSRSWGGESAATSSVVADRSSHGYTQHIEAHVYEHTSGVRWRGTGGGRGGLMVRGSGGGRGRLIIPGCSSCILAASGGGVSVVAVAD